MTTTHRAPAGRTATRKPAARKAAPKRKALDIWEEFKTWSTLAFWASAFGYWTFTSHKILFPVVIFVLAISIMLLIRQASRR
jgi:hypothetical protein